MPQRSGHNLSQGTEEARSGIGQGVGKRKRRTLLERAIPRASRRFRGAGLLAPGVPFAIAGLLFPEGKASTP